MLMKTAAILLFLACATALTMAAPPTTALKVKIDGTELDRRLLMDKLNAHGDSGFLFTAAEENYDYRISFETGQQQTQVLYGGSGGTMNSSGAHVSVFDGNGKEMFRFAREQRWTDAGAANAAAKEIIKRLRKLRTP